jgi:RNA methyltransferase, TrmH family
MINNSELKYIQSFAHKKHWAEESTFIVEGPKMVQELLRSNWTIKKIYATSDWIQGQGVLPVPVIEVDQIMLERMSQMQTPHQVIALAEKETFLKQMPFDETFSLLLDGIQDPGNLGTIIRTADWFGVKQILVSEDTAGFYNPKVLQSTMGSCFRVRVESVNLETIVKATALPVYGAQLNGTSMYETAIAPTGFLMIGNESKGIGNHLIKYVTHPIKIPKYGNAESLNAAVATGIILSHWKV